MAKIHLVSILCLVAATSVAIAAPAVRDIHRAQAPVSVQKQLIDDTPLDPSLAPAAAFASAIESALATSGSHSVTDPDGVFVVRVTHVGRDRVIDLARIGSNEPRHWKLSGDATDAVVGATISEIMVAARQKVGPPLSGTGPLEAFSEK